jgi:surface antigen
MFIRATAAILVASVLAGCVGDGGPSRETLGAVTGLVAGAAIGSAFGEGSGKAAAIAGGAILGGFAGSYIGKSLDDDARARHDAAWQDAMYDGQSTSWSAASGRSRGTINVGKENVSRKYHQNGVPEVRLCRDYVSEIVVDGRKERMKGRACRGEDGFWRPVDG